MTISYLIAHGGLTAAARGLPKVCNGPGGDLGEHENLHPQDEMILSEISAPKGSVTHIWVGKYADRPSASLKFSPRPLCRGGDPRERSPCLESF